MLWDVTPRTLQDLPEELSSTFRQALLDYAVAGQVEVRGVLLLATTSGSNRKVPVLGIIAGIRAGRSFPRVFLPVSLLPDDMASVVRVLANDALFRSTGGGEPGDGPIIDDYDSYPEEDIPADADNRTDEDKFPLPLCQEDGSSLVPDTAYIDCCTAAHRTYQTAIQTYQDSISNAKVKKGFGFVGVFATVGLTVAATVATGGAALVVLAAAAGTAAVATVTVLGTATVESSAALRTLITARDARNSQFSQCCQELKGRQ